MKQKRVVFRRCGSVLMAGVLLTGVGVADAFSGGQLPVLQAAAATAPESSFQYSITNGEATITKFTGTEVQVEVPSTLGGYPVTAIGSTAFRGNKTMQTLILPEGVRSIGDSAFYYCPALEKVTLPSSLKTIGAKGFCLCQALREVELPEGLETLGGAAFATCTGLERVTLPSGLQRIENDTFSTCTVLKEITLPDSLTAVGEKAFYNCTAISEVTLPDSLETLEKEAFGACSGLKTYRISANNGYFQAVEGVLYSKDGTTLIACPGGKEGVVTVPSGVKTIGVSAFSYCNKVTGVELPKGLTTVEAYAFSMTGGMDSLRLPSGVESLGQEAFASTTLTNITVPASVTTFGTQVFAYSPYLTIFGKKGSKAEEYALNSQIPFAVAGTFTNCSYLTRTTIPTFTAVQLKGSAVFGKGECRYAFYYKKSGSSVWTPVGEKYGNQQEATLYLSTVNTYKVMVKVKDEQGRIQTKIMEIKAVSPSKSDLVNTSTVSATSLQRGNTLTITGASSGGYGTVKYAFYCKKSTTKGYTAIGEVYGSETAVTYKPARNAEYDIRVLARDGLGTVAIKQYRVSVSG